MALFATLLATGSAYAMDTVHSSSTTGTINWTDATWSTAVLDWTATAGDVARMNGTAATTYTLDTNVTVGSVRYSGASGWTVASDGTHTLTLDGTGLSAANQLFGHAGVASIGQANGNASAARTFNLGNATTGLTINMATDLDIGITPGTGSALNTYGSINNTSDSAKTLTFLNNSNAGSSGAPLISIHSSIGVTGSAVNIVNAGTNDGSTPKAGRGTVTISGSLGTAVSSITQSSATSQLIINGDNSAFVGNTSVTVGKLSIGSNYTFAAGTDNHLSLTGAAAPVAGADFGQVLVTAGTTTFGGDLTLDFTGTAVDGAVYDLFSASGSGALGGSFSSVSIAGTYAASLTNNSGVWTGSSNGFDFSFSEATGDLTIAAAIPEPTTCAFLAGLVTLGFIAVRRRRA